jgi:hypothetical protein
VQASVAAGTKAVKTAAVVSGIQVATGSRSATQVIRDVKILGEKVADALLGSEGVGIEAVQAVLAATRGYEEILMNLVAENERLRGRLEAQTLRPSLNYATVVASGANAKGVPMPPPATATVPKAVKIKKPVETWSVVVRSKNREVQGEEVARKVATVVAPSLGVRVHEVKPIRGGGVVIRTPSLAEREKVARNAKFEEAGLDVSVNVQPGPRVVVQAVHASIAPDVFMSELYKLNFAECMTQEAFQKGVKLVSRPWKVEHDTTVNVVLEGSALDALLDNGRCYIQWFSFRVRSHRLMPGCFRCLSFDHRVAECKLSEDVCKRCGQSGHKVTNCKNAVHCRNCAFKGRPAGHHMMSAECPVYSGIVARALARH